MATSVIDFNVLEGKTSGYRESRNPAENQYSYHQQNMEERRSRLYAGI
jgi:hypothetical protein